MIEVHNYQTSCFAHYTSTEFLFSKWFTSQETFLFSLYISAVSHSILQWTEFQTSFFRDKPFTKNQETASLHSKTLNFCL